jgi:hypothetical protein
LQRIKKAAETGATELDLGGQGLTELPPEIVQLPKSCLKRMNKYGEFKPNVIGLGFNFNAFFDDLL